MKKMVFTFCAALLLMSACKQKPAENTEATTTDSTTTAAPMPSGPTVPFKAVMIKHPVKDFASWLTVYNSPMADSIRNVYGNKKLGVCRGIPDSNTVYVFEEISDLAKAKEFASSATLKDAMSKAGVTGKPEVHYLNVTADNSPNAPSHDFMLVSHKVKDYAAWKKVFDAEGAETRKSFGIVDNGLAQDCDDPNMVYIEFSITDQAKAKARGASPELKKLMDDAGVIGKPVMEMYRSVH